MHNVLSKLAKHLGNMSVDQDNLVKQNKFLLEAERKAKVDTAVRLLTNPMSVRVVRYNYHLRFHIEDLLTVFNPDDSPLVSDDLDTVNDLVSAATSVLKEVVRLIKRETEMHTVAMKSHIGWRVATVLDQDELDLEEKEESKLLSTKAITAAEKQYMTFQIDKAKTLQYSKNGAGYGGMSKAHPEGLSLLLHHDPLFIFIVFFEDFLLCFWIVLFVPLLVPAKPSTATQAEACMYLFFQIYFL